MQLRRLTDPHHAGGNARRGFETMKNARACAGSMQFAPPYWRAVNPEEAALAALVFRAIVDFSDAAAEIAPKMHNSCG
jgi:hypothetical protein